MRACATKMRVTPSLSMFPFIAMGQNEDKLKLKIQFSFIIY